jgi:hypothetical protein
MMGWELTWGGDPEDLLITTWGVATLDGLDNYAREGMTDERFRPDMRLLVDHRRLDFTGLTSSDFRERADSVAARSAVAPDLAIAVVVGRTVDYGLLRMQATLIADRTGDQYALFYSMDEARQWLRRASGLTAGLAHS